MNSLQVFNFKQNEVRTILKDGEPWFVAKDVASILEFKDAFSMCQHLDDDEKQNLQLEGFKRGAIAISESGLYSAILRSRKPEAKEFKRWITHEVIPSIRKHGAYMTPETLEKTISDPDFLIGLLTNLKEEKAKRVKAEQERNQLIEQQKADLPYTSFGKVVSNSTGAVSIGAFAKMLYDKHGINIGRNKLFEWLRSHGYLISGGREHNNPKQIYLEQGLFVVKPTIVSRTEGDVEKLTPLITGKGQIKIAELLIKEFEAVV
ncbi:phage antirepressor [Heyndrickxia faecalis]|uniref:phage antirepressor n=1 Tax=Heyndrickxia faecalis TaxID=2824910 RepID=UPI0032B298EB